jgi:3-phosphoshikimate 1-carboxyvinyltransferase
MSKMQDIVPTLAVLCAFISEQKTEICNIENLKYKECDRFNAVISELRKIGVPVDYTADSIIITGIEKGNVTEIETYKDHRMAMAFTLAGIKIPGLKIKNPECVCKTFPEFYKDFLEIFDIKNNYTEFYSEIYNKQLEKFNIYCTL